MESDGIISVTEQTQAHPDFNHTSAPAEEVIVGNYYNYQKTTREGCIFVQSRSKDSNHSKQSIMYVGIDVTPKKKSTSKLFFLQTVDHEDILCSL